MRPRRSFWVILHTKDRFALVAKALDCLIIEVDTVYGHIGRQGFGIDSKSVILGSDLDPPGAEIFDRLIGPTMTKLQLESFSTQRLTQNLVPQANPENRNTTAYQLADGLNRIGKC